MHKRHKRDESLTLKGAKHEKTMQMYVKNIEVECDEKTAEIEKKVKTYIEKCGVNTLKVQVVKKHFVDTMVYRHIPKFILSSSRGQLPFYFLVSTGSRTRATCIDGICLNHVR